ncbi:putative 2OG-Fe(II) oxygenase family oxidoreductase [Annulohypoxylon nitens]|nr:putative 2OG-Fe(II) oxygenase family oxidoreductase [Annulohypoxylon nitens]
MDFVPNDDSEPLVPTVDIGAFLSDDSSPEAQKVVESVRAACKKTGFFQITGHGLPERIQRELFQAAQRFFSLNEEVKTKLDARTTVGRRGYDAMESQSYHADTKPDLKEGFFVGHDYPLDDPNVQAKRFFMGQNVWPESTVLSRSAFRGPVETYFQEIHTLALKMLEIIERTLCQGSGVFRDFTRGNTVSVLRILHYPPVPSLLPVYSSKGIQQQLGAGAHTDFGAITLLLQDEHSGLEVLDPMVNTFVSVNPTPNAIVFNVGDMLSFWTGNEYKSSVHRVINKASEDRYSAAFFYDGALDCTLEPFYRNDTTTERNSLNVEQHLLKRINESYGSV